MLVYDALLARLAYDDVFILKAWFPAWFFFEIRKYKKLAEINFLQWALTARESRTRELNGNQEESNGTYPSQKGANSLLSDGDTSEMAGAVVSLISIENEFIFFLSFFLSSSSSFSSSCLFKC
jgi:hypothetical protein